MQILSTSLSSVWLSHIPYFHCPHSPLWCPHLPYSPHYTSQLPGVFKLLRINLLSLNPDPTVLCCIRVWGLRQDPVCCLVGGSVSERSQESGLVKTAGIPMESSSSSASSSLSIIQPRGSFNLGSMIRYVCLCRSQLLVGCLLADSLASISSVSTT